jgi:hypothetical protein
MAEAHLSLRLFFAAAKNRKTGNEGVNFVAKNFSIFEFQFSAGSFDQIRSALSAFRQGPALPKSDE